jgi:hypothetical protein
LDGYSLNHFAYTSTDAASLGIDAQLCDPALPMPSPEHRDMVDFACATTT